MSGIEESGRPGLLLTAFGPDRPGMVSELAQIVTDAGGNIEDTRMAKLGGEFALLVLVTGSLSSLAHLSSRKPEIEDRLGVTCSFKETTQSQGRGDGLFYQLEVSGLDRPGIVRTVSEVLSHHRVNVSSLSSKVVHAPLTGTPMFILEADLSVPTSVPIAALRQALTAACDRENLDYSLDLGRA